MITLAFNRAHALWRAVAQDAAVVPDQDGAGQGCLAHAGVYYCASCESAVFVVWVAPEHIVSLLRECPPSCRSNA